MLPTPVFAALAALAGLVAGANLAFLAPRVVAHRLDPAPTPPGPSLLVPVLGGRLAGWHPAGTAVLEAVTAASFAAFALHYGLSIRFFLACAYTLWLLLIATVDLQHRLVLNRLSYPGIVLALAASAVWPGLGPRSALLGALVGLACFLVLQILGRGALGTGDTKLAVLIGAMRGVPGVLNTLLLGVLIGGFGAIFYLIFLRRGRKESMPYAPYLVAGAILSFLLYPP